MPLPDIVIEPSSQTVLATQLAFSASACVAEVTLSFVVPLASYRSSVSLAPASLTRMRIGWGPPLQPARIEAGALGPGPGEGGLSPGAVGPAGAPVGAGGPA